jgi:putative transposase
MKQEYPVYCPQFFTATIYEWKHLLAEERHKNIIIESLQFLVTEKRIELNAFVIMSNHIHLIWQPLFDFTGLAIQASFMKHTARQLKLSLLKNDETFLADFKVNKHDRGYQLWKREPLSIELITAPVFNQKLEYIHDNPVRAGLCKKPEDYYYSSARFYYDGTNSFGMLTHFSGN